MIHQSRWSEGISSRLLNLLSFQLNQVSQLWVMTQPEAHPSSSTVAGGLNANSTLNWKWVAGSLWIMPALFLEFIWGPRTRSISPPGHWGLSEALQASWLRRGMEQTGSDFCPKASVSYRSGCQLGRMSRQQSRCVLCHGRFDFRRAVQHMHDAAGFCFAKQSPEKFCREY